MGAFALAAAMTSEPSPARSPSRDVVPWAWQRAEDLRFADVAEVAYLAATARIDGARLRVEGRRQPLQTRSDVRRIPVLRVEVSADTRTEDLDAHRAAIVALLRTIGVGAERVQIDFDARRSERGFYGALLNEARAALPAATRLSITALASWCLGDPWLDGLPVDEVVPMLFRLGPEEAFVRTRLEGGRDFGAPICRRAYGLSTDEPLVPLRPGRRIYLFHPRPWRPADLDGARRRLEEPRS
jgi:hypothetical protein